MSKITETYHCPPNVDCPCYTKMWDEIDRLRAELALIRKATLEEAAKVADKRVDELVALRESSPLGHRPLSWSYYNSLIGEAEKLAAAIRKLGEE